MQLARRLGMGLVGLAVTAAALAVAAQQQSPGLFRRAETVPLWLAAAGAVVIALILGLVLLRLPARTGVARQASLHPVAPATSASAATSAGAGETPIGGLAPLLLALAEEELARVEEALVASDPEAARTAALRLSEAAQAMGLAGLAGDTLALAEWLAATPPVANGAIGAMAGIRGALDELRSRSGQNLSSRSGS